MTCAIYHSSDRKYAGKTKKRSNVVTITPVKLCLATCRFAGVTVEWLAMPDAESSYLQQLNKTLWIIFLLCWCFISHKAIYYYNIKMLKCQILKLLKMGPKTKNSEYKFIIPSIQMFWQLRNSLHTMWTGGSTLNWLFVLFTSLDYFLWKK